MLEIKVIH